jgi:hypothetical protein
MKIWVIMAVQDQPDTRVDHGAEIKHVICALTQAPTEKRKKSLLRKWAKEQEEDVTDFWVEVEETTCV